jgi:hypothetical protein
MSRPLHPLEKFQIVTTGLFVVVGLLILARSFALGAPWPAYLLGVIFLAYGLYRRRLIRQTLDRRNSR